MFVVQYCYFLIISHCRYFFLYKIKHYLIINLLTLLLYFIFLFIVFQFKLDPRLARLLGVHTQTRPVIISALWQYIKTHKLQDSHEREFINCDKYLEQIFACPRMKFAEIPQRLNPLLHPPDPIVINHVISVEGRQKILLLLLSKINMQII